MRQQIQLSLFRALRSVSGCWTGLTPWGQHEDKQYLEMLGDPGQTRRAPIIYNSDEQVCREYAAGLSAYGFQETQASAWRAVSV